MPSIDERVVAMAFENAKFEAGVATTLRTLEKLNASLANVGRNNGLAEIEKAAEKVTLAGPMSALDKLKAKLSFGSGGSFQKLESEADKVTLAGPIGAFEKLKSKLGFPEAQKGFSDIQKGAAEAASAMAPLTKETQRAEGRFNALQIAAGVALGGIATKAALAAGQLTKNLTLGPIKQGLDEYGLKLNSIQTLMSATGDGIKPVTKALNELNVYSDKTIYSFKNMIENIPKFANAGVPLEKSVKAIQGVAQVAALSGANTEEASRSMYNFAQAVGSGTLRMQDWRSIEIANMGTQEFKQQLIDTGLAMGTLKKESDGTIKSMKGNEVTTKTFNKSLEDQWVTADVLTDTLAKYTDETSNLGKKAFAAATDIKTGGQLMGIFVEQLGSGWAQTFEALFGNLEEAKDLWGSVNNVIGGFIQRSSDARNEMLQGWKKLGGRADVIEGVKNLFEALMSVLKPIGQAFRDIFPRQTAESLVAMSKRFREFTADLKLSGPAMDNLRRIFAGLFAVLHIGWTVIKETVIAIADLLGIVGKGSGGILNFAGSIGDFLVSLDKAISQGGLLKGVFAGIVAGLGGIIEVFKAVGSAIGSIFTGADKATGLSDAMRNLAQDSGPLAAAATFLADAWDRVRVIFGRIAEFLAPIIETVKHEAARIGEALQEAFQAENFDKVMSVLQTGFLGGILLILKRFKNSLNITLEGGLFEKVNTILGALTGNLKAMQQNLQAKTLFAIAASLGVLVAGIYVLSTIDGKKLTTAMTAMAVGMGQLVGAIGLLGKLMSGPGKAGILMMPFIAASLIGLAVAATILAAAVKIFSTMSWEELVKGLVGVGVALTAVGTATKLLGPGLLIQGPALIALAIGLNILAAAVKQFAELDWEEIAKGVTGIAGSLVALAAGLAFMGPSLLLTGPGLIAASIGINMLAGAVSAFGSMDVGTLAKGIFGIAGAIVALGLSISLIPPTVALQGAGLILLAAGLTGLSAAIAILGNMEVKTLVKGIIAMGGALVVLGLGLTAMSGTLIGSAALLTAAAAFAILGPAIAFIGNLKWGTILSALGAMALTLGVLALAGTVVAGPLTVLAVSLGALGIALALITSPIYLLAKALEIMGATGTKGVAVMVAALTAFVAILPKIVIDFLKGIVDIVAGIAELAPKVVSSIGIIIGQLLAVIVDAAPKVAIAVLAIVTSFVRVLNEGAPKLFDAGFRLIGAFLSSLSANVGKLTAKAAEIITKFLDGLKGQSPRITTAGVGTLTAFLTGISNKFPALVGTVYNMVVKFVNAVASNIPKIIGAATNLILKFIGGIVSMVPRIIAAGVTIIGNFLTGIAKSVPKIVSKAAEVAGKFITGVSKGLVRLVNIGADAVIDFLNGVAAAIRTKGPQLRAAGYNIADAILDGIVQGFKELGSKAIDAVKGLISELPKGARKILGIHSPSKVFKEIGKFTMLGLDEGIRGHGPQLSKTATGIGDGIIGAFKDVFQIRSPSRVLKDIGREVGRGFAQGLDGSAADIRNSFRSMNDKLRDEMRTQKDAIRTGQKEVEDLRRQHAEKLDEISDLRRAKKPDADAIKTAMGELKDIDASLTAAERSLSRHRDILRGVSGAHAVLTGSLQAEKGKLVALSKELDTVTENLDTAQQALDQITQDRASFLENTRDQFNTLPDIDKDSKTQVADYKKKLQEQIEATRKFYETMTKLRAAGLDDATFRKLLSEGLGSADFAEELLKGGTKSITEVNDLDRQLLEISTKLGSDAAGMLYDTGVQAAQGLVDGLKAKQKELTDAMNVIADAIVNRIKAALGIRSPSRVLMELGKFAMEGMAAGIKKGSEGVDASISSAAQSAVDQAKDAFGKLALLDGVIEANPVITPVLDLSQVQKDAQQLGALTNVVPITAAASYGQASAISAEQAAAAAAAADPTAVPVNHVELTQNNYSPEALSDIEIYRQTNNQLSQVKSALGVAK